MTESNEAGSLAELAVFGAAPLFSRARTTGQLANRDPDRFFALASGAFERRWLTNQGPLVQELEERLCRFHGTAHCVTFANACFALALALRTLARPGAKRVLLPALTFRGLPHLIRWAGLEPQYCDVDPVTHTLAPESLARHIGPDTAAVLAVDNVNALCDIDAIERLTGAAGVPLLMDCVYGIGGSYGRDRVGSRGRASVFSLHATKLINGFEGGYLTTDDDALALDLRSQRNFGFGDDGLVRQLGLNGKLNELHAAFALSNLPHVQSIVDGNAERFAAYRHGLAGIPWVSFADYSRSPGTYSLVLLRVAPDAPYTRDALIRILRAENALVRPYYAPPLHRVDPVPASGGAPAVELPVSDQVSREFIQMPVGDLVSVEDIGAISRFFTTLDRRSGSIAGRLRELPR
ncbi:DegT/DnrJ/EryC1/StrS family aminotransferase [Azospirillum doebereinerae]|uniref:Aminotransferase class I/II-fold pyridoxal phosphate-dependent enzyme n=1 Tax=Azospirillum doebereinerae TaxID=92933 RepID=A0A433J6Q6_9PROT|nr:aminotransferase class I/II-fold pyridoxal phosphate-dependent enzyme [Azospirillum doebereinerae]RUQ68852.1 aminotransferase class I/II-fold pyridoxal phosphate-dependent enzyme [Azospirillum doebereinerae]